MTENTQLENSELPEPIATIWRWLRSLPVATGVIIILALLSAVGTIIPQEHLARPEMGMSLEEMYLERFGERYWMIKRLGLTHIYFTPYFFVLMLWLSVSAVICTINRIKKTFKQFKTPRVVQKARFFTNDSQAIVLEDVVEGATDKLVSDLKAKNFRVKVVEEDKVTHVYADRGYLQRWAVAALHVSVIILLLGAVYGKIFGTEGYIRMPDGATKPLTLDFSSGKHKVISNLVKRIPSQTYELAQDSFFIDYDRKIQVPTTFAKIPEHLQEYYRYFVKDFVSKLTVSKDGKQVSGQVIVNHPIRLGKLVLYQSGYQQQGHIIVEQNGSESEYILPSGVWFALGPRGPISIEQARNSGQIIDEIYHAEQVKAGELYVGGESQGQMGPMTIFAVASMSTGAETHQIISPTESYSASINGAPAVIRMSEKMNNFSDFSYKLDPGIPVLYFGWILLTLGIFLSMYITFTRVWLMIADDRVFVLMTGRGGIESVKQHYGVWRDLVSKD